MVPAGAQNEKGRNRKSRNAYKKDGKAAAATALHEPERCARCGAIMIETYCKVLCTNCGFMRDCNDQW